MQVKICYDKLLFFNPYGLLSRLLLVLVWVSELTAALKLLSLTIMKIKSMAGAAAH